MAAQVGLRTVAAAVALVVVGFAGGFLAATVLPKTSAGAAVAQASADGVAWPFFGRPRAASAPRAQASRPEGFAVWTTRVDTRGASPSDCIRMSRALDPSASYGDFVSVSPTLDHPAAVTVAGDELCVADVGYADRTITLLRGLPGAGGQRLADNVDVAFSAGSKPVYVGFAGEGVILPREDSDGVGLETVNVSRLHVEVWRVADHDLVRKTLEAREPSAEGEYYGDYGPAAMGEDGRKLWEGQIDVHAAADQRATTVFPLGAVLETLQPGAYVVVVQDASGIRGAKARDDGPPVPEAAQARRWIVFTDMALQAYDGSDALDVLVRSLKTARAMAGVRVALTAKDGGELASAVSDGAGHVRFVRALLAGERGAQPARVMAYGPGGDFTLIDLERAPVDLSKADVTGRAPPGASPATGKDAVDPSAAVDGFLYADRGIYRPGESAHLVGLVRDRQARSVADRAGALVVRRPSGLEFLRSRFKTTPNGAATLDVQIPAGAPRGLWRASLQMDGAEHPSGEVTFQVEDFAPQRLAVSVAAGAERPVVGGERRAVEIDARFLYGATAVGLPVRTDARISADPDPFPAYKGYAWGDQKTPFAEKLLQNPPTVTDGAGRAHAILDAGPAADAVQPLRALFTAQVFEPGGRPVSEQLNLKLHPRPLYLGVSAHAERGPDAAQAFDVIAVDAQGRRIAAPHTHWLLISEVWNYDWFEKDGRWAWRRTSRDIPLAQGDLAIGAGGAPGRISRKLGWGDYRLVLDDPASGAHTVIRHSQGWETPPDGGEPPDTARVSAERTGYRTGDTIAVRIEAPFAGEAQIAVATDRLLTVRSASVPAGGTTVRLRADAAWGGGAYVLVTVVQPRDPVSSPKPRRALGLVWVPLEPVGRKLTVALSAPSTIDSHAPVVVPLKVDGLQAGQRAHVTLAAVDEGILRLTHQANPDPAGWYFGKRALSLAYRDDYGRLLDANLGPAAAVSFGGDEFGGAELSVVPIRTVALWSGVVETDERGRAVIRLPAEPLFNGQLRLVAVAWTDTAVGAGASDMIVRQPVIAELALPRFLAPGDRALATLELDDVAGRPGGYSASVLGRGGPTVAWRKTLTLGAGQRVAERVEIGAGDRPSVGEIDLTAAGPGFAASRSYPLQVRLGWGRIARADTTLQPPGAVFTPAPALLAGLAAGEATMTVSYSPFAGFDPVPIAEALRRYPYGCSEQLASTGYAALYAPDFTAPGKLRPLDPSKVSALLDREALDGSFGLWRAGDGEADPWLGAYVVDFLLDARAHGAAVPGEALTRALTAMQAISRPDGFYSGGYRERPLTWPGRDMREVNAERRRAHSRASAYALYVLAKAGEGDLARLRWFHDQGFAGEPSPLARAQVGAALAAMGDHSRAHDSFVQAVSALGYKEPDDWYQSPLRDLAGVVALAWEAGETGIARSLQPRLETATPAPGALNTQEQAQLLKAAHAMAAAAGPVRILASGARPSGVDRWAVGRLADARFVNAGAGPIWRTVTVTGFPVSPPAAESHGLRLEKRLFALDGGAVDPARLRQGDRVIVRLSGSADAQRPMLTVVDDALPAGFEVEGLLTPADAQGEVRTDENGAPPAKAAPGAFAFLGALSTPSIQQKRDDRYVANLTLVGGKPFALAYIARVVTPGEFFLPGAEARDMYRPAVVARTAASRVRIAPAS
jgi:uncharacterized protein YfaS (alpha-2-macroglobulin family)